jgi:hypothetical protein
MDRTDDNKSMKKRYLSDEYPDLIASEWHWSFNHALDIDPGHLSVTSNKQVYWKCSTCGSISHMAPRKRMEDLKRNKTSCFQCRGMVQLHPFTI